VLGWQRHSLLRLLRLGGGTAVRGGLRHGAGQLLLLALGQYGRRGCDGAGGQARGGGAQGALLDRR